MMEVATDHAFHSCMMATYHAFHSCIPFMHGSAYRDLKIKYILHI